MATNFRTALAANVLWPEITTWGFRLKDGLFSFNPCVCWSLCLDSYLRRSELLQAGDCQVGNWHVNCQHSSSDRISNCCMKTASESWVLWTLWTFRWNYFILSRTVPSIWCIEKMRILGNMSIILYATLHCVGCWFRGVRTGKRSRSWCRAISVALRRSVPGPCTHNRM